MTEKTEAGAIFRAFEQLRVLIVGDIMIDRYIHGAVSRISPEAPVPVVQLQQIEDRVGGAANVALNIKAMGATPYLCSVAGSDANGAALMALMAGYGLPSEGIVKSNTRTTTVKTRIIAQHQHLLRLDEEDTHDLSAQETELLIGAVNKLLDSIDIHVIIFQDYNKGVLTANVIQSIMDEAGRRGIPTTVDPKNKNFWAYHQATLFKPNLKEIQQQVSFAVGAEADSLQRAAHYIREKLDNRYTLITLSDKGLFIENDGRYLLAPTHPRDIADVCGAGDTVISIASLAVALSLSIEDTALLANLAGGQVCEHVGVAPVDKEQLLQEFELVRSGSFY